MSNVGVSLHIFVESNIRQEVLGGRRVKCKESERGALGNAFPQGAVVQERGDQVKGRGSKQLEKDSSWRPICLYLAGKSLAGGVHL